MGSSFFTPNFTLTNATHSHTQVFFVFDPNHPRLFMLPTICLALALVEKTWFI
jgi:hypothetical protein